jgi:hypothetical protein
VAIRRAVLVIADIGGYTHYMQWNRESSFFRRLGATMKLELSSLQFVLGFNEPAAGFRNLGRGAEEIPA